MWALSTCDRGCCQRCHQEPAGAGGQAGRQTDRQATKQHTNQEGLCGSTHEVHTKWWCAVFCWAELRDPAAELHADGVHPPINSHAAVLLLLLLPVCMLERPHHQPDPQAPPTIHTPLMGMTWGSDNRNPLNLLPRLTAGFAQWMVWSMESLNMWGR